MTRDHNEKTDQEHFEDRKFLEGYADLKSLTSDMAGIKGDMNAVYKRLKDMDWSKKDFEFARSLEDKDVGQVIADFERKIRIAKLFGHRLGRQVELFDEDRTPQEDRAYEEGLAAGKQRKQVSNPYTPGTAEYQNWQKGMNDGTAWANRDLDEAINGSSGDDDGDGNDDSDDDE